MNWNPGDKAVCTRTALWRESGTDEMPTDSPVNGGVYLVELVWNSSSATGLHLAGFQGWWDASEFRKIVPETEWEESRRESEISA